MSVTIERPDPVSGLEWTVLRGDRERVFRALGAEHADLIAAQRSDPESGWSANVRRSRTAAADRFAVVVASTKRQLPVESAEVEWIAAGAGVDAAELWAQNLRGDLGRDGTGCSDLSLATGSGVVLGHNEDGDGELRGLIRLVTLDIEGDPTMTVVWYPGMLPANSFVTTSAGLTFGMDHVPVRTANLDGCGRHFVARRAQRQATGDAARAVLTDIACAGGFAFDVADAHAVRVDLIENAAGRVAAVPFAGGELARHTNHLRIVDGAQPGLAVAADDEWLAESRTRFGALCAASQCTSDAADVLAALRARGVRNDRDEIYTFTTTVIDSAADEIVVQGSGEPWRGRWGAFARGERVDA